MKPAIILFSFLLFALTSSAQSSYDDLIILKNGSQKTGQIIKYEQGGTITLLQENGDQIEIKESVVKRVVQSTTVKTSDIGSGPYKIQKTKYSKEKISGNYMNTQLVFAMGDSEGDGLALGAGTNIVFGRQFSPLIGFGLGIGLDNYARRGETIYPIFLETRSYLPTKNKPGSYYFSLSGGYGFAFKRESLDINEAEGGYLAHPAFGYRTTTKEGVDVNFDAGVKFQKARFSRTLYSGDVEVRDLTFQRFTIRVGITLWSKNNRK